MAKKLYEESNIRAIAEAIRAKNGKTETYTTAQMAGAIADITAGGGGGTTIDDLMNGTAAAVNLPTATKILQYAFYKKTAIESVTMPNVTAIETYAFYQCSNLEAANLPDNLASIGERAFMQCSNLVISTLPSASV